MDCESFQSQMVDFLEADENSSTAGVLRAHLETCGICAEAFARLRAGQSWADAMPLVDPPAKLDERILAAARTAVGERRPKVAPGPSAENGRSAKVIPLFRRAMRSGAAAQFAVAAALLLMVSVGFLEFGGMGSQGDLAEPRPLAASETMSPSSEGEAMDEARAEAAEQGAAANAARQRAERMAREAASAAPSEAARAPERNESAQPLEDFLSSTFGRRGGSSAAADERPSAGEAAPGRANAAARPRERSLDQGRTTMSAEPTGTRADGVVGGLSGGGNVPSAPAPAPAPEPEPAQPHGESQTAYDMAGAALDSEEPRQEGDQAPALREQPNRSAPRAARGARPAPASPSSTAEAEELSGFESEDSRDAPVLAELLRRGITAYSARDYGRAISLLRAALREAERRGVAGGGERRTAHLYLARSHAGVRDWPGATRHYRAMGAGRERGAVLLEFADALARSGSAAEADRMYALAEREQALAARARRSRARLRAEQSRGSGMAREGAAASEAAAADEGL